ncbi:hypothetical protein D1006_23235 [Burkholderia stabilis]|uniref:Uncharacterized protein n=1 Tax=Burkholderia stabilis TaxID=95485 RepID=A0A4Q2AF28_9BURK|nr:hypothetical protein D1006_23235 [Burkholderia stabilis]
MCPIDDIDDVGIRAGFEGVPNRPGRGPRTGRSPGGDRLLKTQVGVGGDAPELSDHGCGNLPDARRARMAAPEKKGQG